MINLFKIQAFFAGCKRVFTKPHNPFKKPVNKGVNNGKQILYVTDYKPFKHNRF